MVGASTKEAVPYINMTPMIDILLVLLIIFYIISPEASSLRIANS